MSNNLSCEHLFIYWFIECVQKDTYLMIEHLVKGIVLKVQAT